jgi:hypothetical protein
MNPSGNYDDKVFLNINEIQPGKQKHNFYKDMTL